MKINEKLKALIEEFSETGTELQINNYEAYNKLDRPDPFHTLKHIEIKSLEFKQSMIEQEIRKGNAELDNPVIENIYDFVNRFKQQPSV